LILELSSKKCAEALVLNASAAESVVAVEAVQTLWSGYGQISRYQLEGGARASVIVKHVKLPDDIAHPRGWNTNNSHQRKVKSYQVESTWYRDYSALCDDSCRVPQCLAIESSDDEFLIVMEDLDAAGFPARKSSVNLDEMRLCLDWLAHFHARFMGCVPNGLWHIGTYWHLDTRPDELEALDDYALKSAAKEIDAVLNACSYQTLVHGDAKLANFCFSKDGKRVAAVDFQYVGGGCGMKDVAYFIGSCLDDSRCAEHEQTLLDSYFSSLKTALAGGQSKVDFEALEAAWRPMFAVAWTDFHRFLKGWSPGHWKIHSYSERVAQNVISQLKNEHS
jgi:Ecdysteroid kinase-like family